MKKLILISALLLGSNVWADLKPLNEYPIEDFDDDTELAIKQGYLANVNLGIAAFNLGDFCVSYHSFDRAVNVGSKLKIKNKKLVEYRDLAKEKI